MVVGFCTQRRFGAEPSAPRRDGSEFEGARAAVHSWAMHRLRTRTRTPDTISIEGLQVDCVVGVYPHERDNPQPLRLDVKMALNTAMAGERARLRMTVDYAAIASQLAFLLQSCRFHLLETAAHALSRYLLAPPALGEDRPRLESVSLRLTKPGALGGNGIPSLEVHRNSRDVSLRYEAKPFGTVDIIHETKSEGIYRLNIAPGGRIPIHVHHVMHESELILGDGLVLNGERAVGGSVYRWKHDMAHGYENPSSNWQSILCVDSPKFDPLDEREVEREVSPVRAEPPFLPLHESIVS